MSPGFLVHGIANSVSISAKYVKIYDQLLDDLDCPRPSHLVPGASTAEQCKRKGVRWCVVITQVS